MKHWSRPWRTKPRPALPDCNMYSKERIRHALAFLVLICRHCKSFVIPVKQQDMYKRRLQIQDAFPIGWVVIMIPNLNPLWLTVPRKLILPVHCCGSKCRNVVATKAGADKCILQQKIFQWSQAWTLQELKQEIVCLCAWGKRN